MTHYPKADISGWFDEGARTKAAYMLVVCDTFDHEDYPVYAKDAAGCRREYDAHHGQNMQRVMEVYDLALDKDTQMNARNVFHLPRI